MNILLRDIPPGAVERIDRAAAAAQRSRQAFLADLLSRLFGDPPIVVGWIALDRDGDEPAADCPSCGQDMAAPHVALLSDGTLTTRPVCGICATSE